MPRFKESYKVVTEEFTTRQAALKVFHLLDALPNVSVHIEQVSMPVVKWDCIDDGYGVVGYSWDCFTCDTEHSFVTPFLGDTYRCSKCHTEHYSDWEEE